MKKPVKSAKAKIELQNLGNITQKWVDLLRPFSNGYAQRFSESELARKSKMPQQTASRRLNSMAKLNLINYAKEGRNKIFYFDPERQTTKIVMNIIEQNKALYFELRTREIALMINELLEYCESIIVFGSYASGAYGEESDLDLVILGKSDKKQIKKSKHLHVIEINEHYTTYNEFSRILSSGNPLSIEITNNHILFGDVSKIVDIFLGRGNEPRQN